MESVLRYLDWTSVGLALLGGLLSLVLLEVFRLNSSRSRIPPGPKPLLFVGNLPQLMKDPMAFIRSMAKYGEMSSMYLGRKPVILLNNMDIMKEAFVQNGAVFAGRPYIPLLNWISNGFGIVMVTYGIPWKQQRRFALHTLRNFGLGKKTVEERVAEEARHLIREILEQEGKTFYPIHPIMNAVSNIICSIIFGDRFEYDDKRFAKLLEILNENMRLGGSAVGRVTTSKRAPDDKRCHGEIVQVLGFDRSACMDDRAHLPYTLATVHEIQRWANVVPLSVLHQTTQPTQLRGCHLPKGTEILPNLTAILTDPEHWKHPDTFNPENFLDEKGQFCKNDFFLPFSLGPRACLGESLAKTELFIFFTSLLQQLRFSWPPGSPHPNMDGIVGIVRSPFPFNTVCHSRETTH
ncbi:cytochrome P450 2J5-like [Salminus brasiliensis]|uniref:cytochrome P450 2J5-like n=1 Tax=Salminus brasiliensis TaxID=930266 RepID=UPI003B82E5B7